MSLPRLPRQPIRPDKEAESDTEIWYPDWKCFCCHDSGLVAPTLTRLVIPDYEFKKDLQPACYRCSAGSDFVGWYEFDQRFNREICNELDKIERSNWTQTVKAKQKPTLDVKKLATFLAMPGTRERTPAEEMEVQRRHEEVCNADPDELKALAGAYLGNDYMKDGPE